MRLAICALLAPLAVAPRIAHANQCDAGRPLLSNHEIPVGCPIRAYLPPGTALEDVGVVVDRGGPSAVDVTDQVTPLGRTDLPIHRDAPDFANECQPTTSIEYVAYDAYDLTFTANVGEVLLASTAAGASLYRTATVVAAGPCPAPEEYLNGSNWIQCSATAQEYQACHDQLCTPFAIDSACGTGSNDLPGDPNDPGDSSDDAGCAASGGASLGALGGPMALLAIAFLRYRRRRRN